MSEPVWVRRDVLELLHCESIAEHGGVEGLRDEGLLESALARPKNLFACDSVTDFARLAASCPFGLAKNHPFVDGNKRIAFIACGMFLRVNGMHLVADRAEATLKFLAIASGTMSEDELAEWVRSHTEPL